MLDITKKISNIFLKNQLKAKQYEKEVAEAYEKRAAEIAASHHHHHHGHHGLHLGLGHNKNEFNPQQQQQGGLHHHHKEKYREIDADQQRHPPSAEAAHVMDFQYLTIMVLYGRHVKRVLCV